jgi:hypothetical protein
VAKDGGKKGVENSRLTMTAQAPAFSAIIACSTLTTSTVKEEREVENK